MAREQFWFRLYMRRLEPRFEAGAALHVGKQPRELRGLRLDGDPSRYLEVSLARDLTRAIRRSQPLAVLMLDLDHFKRFNDTYGHDGGDALLAQFGALLAALVRTEDVACRYGGEEFTIVMQEADSALALDRAEDIRRHVEAMQVSHRQRNLGQVTVSIGIASYPQHGNSPEQLMRCADHALYTAKSNGRNQVCVADRG